MNSPKNQTIKSIIDNSTIDLYSQVETALNYVSPDCSRDEWFKLLCSIHDALNDNGYELAKSWSQQSDKFNAKNFNYTWINEVGKKSGVTKAYLFKLAYENGMPKLNPPTAHQEQTNDLTPLEQFNRCKPFTSHPYITEKGLNGKLNGYECVLRLGHDSFGSWIADPIYNLETREFMGFNRIKGSGKNSKGLAKGTKKAGNASIVGNLNATTKYACICEGLADALHIHNETRYPVLIASDAGNLKSVVKVITRLYPKLTLIICADNDTAGIKAAENAARESKNCVVAYPPSGKDFTESVLNGNDIKTVIINAINPVKTITNKIWDWTDKKDKYGIPISCVENIEAVFLRDREWQGILAYNEFTRKVMKLKKPPIKKGKAGEWLDADDSGVRLWLSEKYKMSHVSKNDIQDIAHYCALGNEFHPIKDYLLAQKWDSIERVSTFLSDSVGCNDTEYTRNVSRCFFIGAVARILQAGCKVDTVLILEGRQGMGKSRLLRALCKDSEWFSDTPFEIGSKDAFLALRGKWIVELSELDTLTRAEATAAKAFFSSQVDSFREPYGRQTNEIPRQNVFAGTVNGQSYLKDPTGNRRYLPIQCEDIDLAYVVENREQIWAEAVHLYKRGVKWWIDSSDAVFAEVLSQQSQRVDTDVWQPEIEKWLAIKEQITIQEILSDCLKIELSKQDQKAKNRVSHILQCLRWSVFLTRDENKKVKKAYRKEL